MLDFILPEPGIRSPHIADDDRNMLEPSVIAAGIYRERTSLGSKVFCQFDELVAQLHTDDPDPQAEDALKMLVIITGHFAVGHLLKREYAGIKIDGPVHVGNGDSDGADSIDQGWGLLREQA